MKLLQWSIAGSVFLVLGATAFWLKRDETSVKQVQTAKLQCELPPSLTTPPKPGMVWIPEGVFDMGDSVYAEEKPVRNVRVKGFWMDRTEVQFRICSLRQSHWLCHCGRAAGQPAIDCQLARGHAQTWGRGV